jgi:hypothetical protein
MQSSSNFFKPWIYISRQWFQSLLLVGFLLWTSILTIETTNVQNSCHPMFDWDRKLTESCPPISKTVTKPIKSVSETVTKPVVNRCPEPCPVQDPKPKFDTTTVSVAAAGVAATIATIAGAPVFVTVGIMIVVGLMAKSVLALAK